MRSYGENPLTRQAIERERQRGIDAYLAMLQREHSQTATEVAMGMDPILTPIVEGPEWPFPDWGTIHDKNEPTKEVF